MASWQELAVPAVAAIVGGWVGAWWQGRTSRALLREQLDDAGVARKEAAADALNARKEFAAAERAALFRDERRTHYVAFLTACSEIPGMRAGFETIGQELRRMYAVADVERDAEWSNVVESGKQTLEKQGQVIAEALRAQAATYHVIQILAPTNFASAAAQAMQELIGPGATTPHTTALLVELAREDLGLPRLYPTDPTFDEAIAALTLPGGWAIPEDL